MDKEKLTGILKSAILLELKGEAFYRKVAETSEIQEIKKIFGIMAKEEVLHAKILRDKYTELSRSNKISDTKLPDNKEDSAADYVLSETIRSQIEAAGFEAAAISAAIDMESKAIELYSKSADDATDAGVKELFNWLADWERGHHKLLFDLDRDLRERIWNDNQFWPF